ncbi:hypothetical protein ASG43_16625 [Aureimonas sp. Leaf454]|uniref:hypothetical protein n=1 Tax=Aureimonas sp. Leaf454 TaxID=1736381 RepID=UPI0006F232C9|nr:hypothetical protein [Aureimonas sp. Leaf454]KQT43129.1 hypothetical protein ASG43_16625 [Aureimonas sp. Leaf454]
MPILPNVTPLIAVLAALLLVPCSPGTAQAQASGNNAAKGATGGTGGRGAGWRWSGGRAALAGASGETIAFTCAGAPATLRLILPGFDASLQGDLDYTVVVTVDGTAFRRTTRAVRGAGGRRDLVETARPTELLPLVDALAAGSKAEIASPAGRETLTLRGSGKALQALKAACP